jgi:flagellar hook-associated protein 1
MSLLSALSVSMTSLRTIQASIATTSSNIANATNDTYTRKKLVVESLSNASNPYGGVGIGGYARESDAVLAKSARDAASDFSNLSTQLDYLNRIGSLFGTTTDSTNLSTYISDFSAAWSALQAAPENATRQSEVVRAGTNVAAEIQRLSAGIEDIDRQAKADISSSVDDLNTSLQNIQKLNGDISAGTISGLPVGDLEDQRDREVAKIASLTHVSVYQRENNTIALYTADGYPLLDITPTKVAFNGTNVTDSLTGTSITNRLTGGKLQALTDLRADTSPATASGNPGSEVIRKLRSQLNTLASSFLSTAASTPQSFASAYNSGTATGTELASSFFTGNDRTDITINAALLNGTATVKKASVSATADAMTASTRSFTADGLAPVSGSYNDLTGAIISKLTANTSSVKTLQETADTANTNYSTLLKNKTGVNLDEELLSLTTLQNSYSASARVIQTVKDMMDILQNLLG